jgi:hypothetical protein
MGGSADRVQHDPVAGQGGLDHEGGQLGGGFHGCLCPSRKRRESFRPLGPFRLCIMHARPITKAELMLASAENTHPLIAIGDTNGLTSYCSANGNRTR